MKNELERLSVLISVTNDLLQVVDEFVQDIPSMNVQLGGGVNYLITMKQVD